MSFQIISSISQQFSQVFQNKKGMHCRFLWSTFFIPDQLHCGEHANIRFCSWSSLDRGREVSWLLLETQIQCRALSWALSRSYFWTINKHTNMGVGLHRDHFPYKLHMVSSGSDVGGWDNVLYISSPTAFKYSLASDSWLLGLPKVPKRLELKPGLTCLLWCSCVLWYLNRAKIYLGCGSPFLLH